VNVLPLRLSALSSSFSKLEVKTIGQFRKLVCRHSRNVCLNIRDIAIVTRGEPDQSLVRMDHPQSMSMQRALESILSSKPTDVEQRQQMHANHKSTLHATDTSPDLHCVVGDNGPAGFRSSKSLPSSVRVTASIPETSSGSFCHVNVTYTQQSAFQDGSAI
jgi:hypothetical protein